MKDLLELTARSVATWISAQRNALRPAGTALSEATKNDFCRYFSVETLDAVAVTAVERIEDPPFFAELLARGLNPPSFADMLGMTFGDTVAVSRSRGPAYTSLLFHELVHVVQYSLLGVDRFAKLYVSGWASAGFAYARIPLEVHAYSLETEFRSSPSPFPVEPAVRRLLRDAV